MKKFLFSIVLVTLLFSRPHYVEGERSWTVGMKLPIVTVSTLPLCNAVTEEARYAVSDGDSSQDCVSGGGGIKARCICDGTNWIPELGGGGSSSVPSLQNSYDTETNPKIISRGGGFTLEGFDSFANSFKLLDPITGQELRMGIDAAGAYFMTLKNGAPWITKLFSGFSWMLTLPNDSPIITADGTTGAITVATSLAGTGSGTVTANRTSCTGTDILKADGTCMSDMVRVRNKVTTDQIITNSLAQTVTYQYAIPANTLGTNSCVVTKLLGTMYNESGSTQTVTVRVRFGGTTGTLGGAPGTGGTVTSALSVSPGTSSTTRANTITIDVCGDGATNAQFLTVNMVNNTVTPASTFSTPTSDSTTQLLLEVSIELQTAHANLTYTQKYGASRLEP